MTIDVAQLTRGSGPVYRRLADALAEAVQDGRLKAGDRLPPQRDLAYRLAVTVGTVGRAYDLLIQRGLARGEVGRGTYVLGTERPPALRIRAEPPDAALIDLTVNEPAPTAAQQRLAGSMAAALGDEALLAGLARYPKTVGLDRHREILAEWLALRGLDPDPARMIVSNGAEGALVTSMLALLRPGDPVLTETLTYPKIKLLAQRLGMRLEPVAMDEDGIIPEALEATARHSGARVAVLTPNLHNPTTAVIPTARREALVEVARRLDLSLVEDDVYGPLLDTVPPPLARLAPERTVYITGASKFLAPGLRLGLIQVAPGLAETMAGLHSLLSLGHTPISAEIFCRALADGTVAAAVAEQQAEMRARQALARAMLTGGELLQRPSGMHAWLRLPDDWTGSAFALTLAREGVLIAASEHFMVGRGAPPRAVRISLSAPRRREQLESALSRIAALLRRENAAAAGIL